MNLLDPLSKRLLLGAGENNFISLMYHSISETSTKPNWEWTISLQNFRNKLDLLEDFGWAMLCTNQLNGSFAPLQKKLC